MAGMFRWIRADLGGRRWQALTVTGVIAGVMAALLLSAAMLEGATNPWPGLFAATRGAQIWIHLAPGTDVSSLRTRVVGITAIAGPYPDAAATLVQGGTQTPVELRAMEPQLPQVGRPLLITGQWLAASQPTGVVLESSFAEAVHAPVGSALVIDGLDGSSVKVRVVGTAETADQGFYPDQTPGLIWMLPHLLHQIEPVAKHVDELAGVRIANPAATSFIVQQVVAELNSRAVLSISTWQQVEQSMATRDPLLGLLLAMFGLVALGAAALAILNATGGRVLLQLADLATLKVLGFTPGQVTIMLVAQHATLAAAGIAIGFAVARYVIPSLLTPVPAAKVAVSLLPWGLVALIAGGVLAAVVLATAIPAWRAARALAVTAIRPSPSRGRLSRLARVSMALRLPPSVIVGAHAAFVRRASAVAIIGGLAIPMLMITIGLGCWSTLDAVQAHPTDIGLAPGLTVSPGAMTTAAARRLIAADHSVAAVYRCVEVTALLPGETTTITTLGMGTSANPYPFQVVAGHLYHGTGEAIATQGLLDVLDLHLGELVQMPIGGVPVTFRIVGRFIDPSDDGEVLAYGRDTLAEAGAAAPPIFYDLLLRNGVSQDAARAWLLHKSGNRLDVEETTDQASQLSAMRLLIAGLIGILVLIGLTNLTTAAAVGRRDHLRDVRVLEALGLTPLQVRASLVTRTAVLALVAVALGALAGLLASPTLINLLSELYGIGSGLGRSPSGLAIAVAVAVAVIAAGLTATIPARRADRLPVSELLG